VFALMGQAIAENSDDDFLQFYGDVKDGSYLKGDFSLKTAQFGQSNSWAGSDEEALGGQSNYWGEYGIAMGLEGEYFLDNGSRFRARVSGVYSSTTGGLDAAGTNLDSDGTGYDNVDKATFEEVYVRWSSGDLYSGLGEDAIELTVGSQVYKQGTGFVLYNGGSDGGERGGFWLGMRLAYQYTVTAKLTTGNWMAEAYYLQPDSPGEETNMAGTNIEYTFNDRANVGFSYTNIFDSDDERRDGLDVFDIRGSVQPIASWTGLRLDGEATKEDNGSKNDSWGGYIRAAYSFSGDTPWLPSVYYRLAHFSGDDGNGNNESFDPLNYGFNDWNEWFIGEILGEYVTSNRNLTTHTVNLRVNPSDSIGVGLYYIYYRLDEQTGGVKPRPPASPRLATIDDSDLAHEVDLIVGWDLNDELYAGVTAAAMIPADGGEQFFGDDKVWGLFMFNVAYSF